MEIFSDELTTNESEIKKLYTKKKEKYYYLNIKKGTEENYFNEGWEVFKNLKTETKIRKKKTFDLQFEEELWCILSKLKFSEMNINRTFKIPILKKIENKYKEVKFFKEVSKKKIETDILDLTGTRGEIIKSIKQHYNKNLKVGFIIAHKNLILSESDIELAKSQDIYLLDFDKLKYYEAIINQIGSSAKYQLLSEIFEGKGIDGLNLKVPAIKGKVQGKIFYSFLIEPAKLLPISFVAHKLSNKDEVDSYQRIIIKSKLQSIKKYIVEEGGLFPNSIILNFNTKGNLQFDLIKNQEENTSARLGYLHLPAKYKSAWIIDGQHRLYGFTETEQANTIPIPVIAFENLNPSYQAQYFVDINSKQKNVPTNLLQELYSSLFWESTNDAEKLLALISRVVNHLNTELNSPLYKQIKSSNKNEGKETPITPATLTTILKRLKLFGEIDTKTNKLKPGILYSLKEPIMDSSLKRSKKILIEYLNIIKIEVSDNWERGSSEGGYLCTNNGLVALLILFKEILKYSQNKFSTINFHLISEEELIKKYILPYLMPVTNYFKTAPPDEIRLFRSKLGIAGQNNASYAMMEKIYNKFPDFMPTGLKQYLDDNDENLTKEARIIVPELQLLIRNDVFQTIKKEYGDEEKGWWFEGIPEPVRKDVVSRKEEQKEESKEKCFDLPHYSDIIRYKNNWKLFEEKYGISEKKSDGKDKKTSWFSKLIEIRNKISHPERGNVTKEEYDLLKKIEKTLKERIKLKN